MLLGPISVKSCYMLRQIVTLERGFADFVSQCYMLFAMLPGGKAPLQHGAGCMNDLLPKTEMKGVLSKAASVAICTSHSYQGKVDRLVMKPMSCCITVCYTALDEVFHACKQLNLMFTTLTFCCTRADAISPAKLAWSLCDGSQGEGGVPAQAYT